MLARVAEDDMIGELLDRVSKLERRQSVVFEGKTSVQFGPDDKRTLVEQVDSLKKILSEIKKKLNSS